MTAKDKENLIEYYRFSSRGEAKVILDLIQETKELKDWIDKLEQKIITLVGEQAGIYLKEDENDKRTV